MENDKRSVAKPRDLECLGPFVGKRMFMELRGETPLIPERREIALSGTIVAVDELSPEKTVTIKIPLSHLATLSEKPIVLNRK